MLLTTPQIYNLRENSMLRDKKFRTKQCTTGAEEMQPEHYVLQRNIKHSPVLLLAVFHSALGRNTAGLLRHFAASRECGTKFNC